METEVITEKKRRGRPRKSDIKIADVSVVTEKKKRGRPKKFNLYSDFKDDINNIFKTYIQDYQNIIDLFLSYKDKTDRINQDDWNIIYNHIKEIYAKFNNDDIFYPMDIEYHYKLNSQYKPIDLVREQQKIKFVYNFINHPLDKDDIIYNGYMIYLQLKLFIKESSKEQKI
jgi:hypothetical protein